MRWWHWHKDRPEFQAVASVKVTMENGGVEPVSDGSIFTLRNLSAVESSPLSTRPNGLATGQNSGYQAVNFAYLAGARRVLLLGFDMRPAEDGRTHWFGDHPVKTGPAIFSCMLQNFEALARRLRQVPEFEVMNCTPGSALGCFPRAALESVLPGSPAAPLPA